MFTVSLADQIIHGTTAGVAELLQAGYDANAIDEYGFTPLIETVIVNNLDMAKLVIHYGAEINAADLTGRTALQWAVDNNNLALCQLLLEHGANPNLYNHAGQPSLTFPLLRHQIPLKRLLYDYQADLNFALDFINTKLIGHRFELIGYTDIIDATGKFIPLNYEGFFLEFTVSAILQSLALYRRNFANREAKAYALQLEKMIQTFRSAAELIKFQHYLINVEEHAQKLDALLQQDLLLLPIANEGHALSFIKYGNLLAKCDRGANSKVEGSVVIYRINNSQLFNTDFIKNFIYEVHPREYIQRGINQILDLETIMVLPIPGQIIGNCSWANIEAAVPTMLFLLLLEQAQTPEALPQLQQKALDFYQRWLRWDQDRALSDCIKQFYDGSPARKAAKAAILAAILFQKCRYTKEIDLQRAEKILKVLNHRQYRYILKSYWKVYGKNKKDVMGTNLRELLDHFGINPE